MHKVVCRSEMEFYQFSQFSPAETALTNFDRPQQDIASSTSSSISDYLWAPFVSSQMGGFGTSIGHPHISPNLVQLPLASRNAGVIHDHLSPSSSTESTIDQSQLRIVPIAPAQDQQQLEIHSRLEMQIDEVAIDFQQGSLSGVNPAQMSIDWILSQELCDNYLPTSHTEPRKRTSAFKLWTGTTPFSNKIRKVTSRQSILKTCLRHLIHKMKAPATAVPHGTNGQAHLPSSNLSALCVQDEQAHQHMLAERKRRGKQNDCFNILRSLIPNNSKKDKVTVLQNTIDHMKCLQDRVSELENRNQRLDSIIAPGRSLNMEDCGSSEATTNRPTDSQPTSLDTSLGRGGCSHTPEVKVRNDIEESLYRIEIQITNRQDANLLITVLDTLNKDLKLDAVSVECMIIPGNIFRANLSVKAKEGSETTFTDALKIQEALQTVVTMV